MYQTNKEKRAILLGMALGDGCINNCNHLVIRHSIKQKEYLEYKKSIVEQIYHCKLKTTFIQSGYQFQKSDKKHFRIYRKWLYRDNKKVISNILRYLNLQSIAFWYMDDGSLTAKKRNGKIHGYELTLNTYESKEENQKIIDWFKDTLNIRFTQCKGKGKYRLRMGTKEAKKFCSLILPYMHDSMMYKVIL